MDSKSRVIAFVRESPTSLLVFVAVMLVAAVAAWRLSKAWLSGIAARNKTDLNQVLAASLPRPIGAAVFFLAADAGMHWFPLEDAELGAVRRWMRFGLGIFAVLTLSRVARKAIDSFGHSNPALRSSSGIGKAIIWVIALSATALLASDALGISLAPALTALGVGSLAVALALQDTLSNFFSGIYVLVDKPVRPGEFVRLDSGQEGYVDSIGWRATILRTLTPSLIVVPNATLAKSVTTNFRTTNPRLSFELRVDVAPDSVVDQVERVLSDEAARAVEIAGVLRDSPPTVRFIPGATRRSLAFTLYYSVLPTADAGFVQSELRKRIHARLLGEKIGRPPAGFVVTSSSSAS